MCIIQWYFAFKQLLIKVLLERSEHRVFCTENFEHRGKSSLLHCLTISDSQVFDATGKAAKANAFQFSEIQKCRFFLTRGKICSSFGKEISLKIEKFKTMDNFWCFDHTRFCMQVFKLKIFYQKVCCTENKRRGRP